MTTDNLPPTAREKNSWDWYWRRAHVDAKPRPAGAHDAVLNAFWRGVFRDAFPHYAVVAILDVACGDGAVTGHALAAMPDRDESTVTVASLDSSFQAIAELRHRHPGAHCVIASATAAPFHSRGFDIVASQFGVEYGGEDGIRQAADLVADGGMLVWVSHIRPGAIDSECRRDLALIGEFRQCEILPRAKAAFDAGYSVMQGKGSVADFEQTEQALAPAIAAMQALLARRDEGATAQVLLQLYRGIEQMYRNMRRYDSGDVTRWLQGMQLEIDASASRLEAMRDAAIDGDRMTAWSGLIQDAGIAIQSTNLLCVEAASTPFASALIARRP